MDPFFGRNSVLRSFQRQRSAVETTAENSTRTAWSFSYWQTVGSGSWQVAEAVPFATTFIEEPGVAFGFSLDAASTPLVHERFPRVTGGVYRWVIDTRGFYTGAHIFFVVDTSGPDTELVAHPLTEPPPVYTLNHTFTFSGTALKDLPTWRFDLD